jgi:pimeloyl-ACP methyl ester carboxylesterase
VDSYTNGSLRFELTDSGSPGGDTVILLHGFPEDRQSWSDVIPPLVEAGHRVLAPDQRGYSPGATPAGRRPYRPSELAGDVLALGDAAEAERFHLVGHDWGAGIGWYIAARHPERLHSWSALSVPHTQAFLRAMTRSSQALHSWYMLAFQLPALPERLLAAGGGRRLREGLTRSGLGVAHAERYAARAAQGRMTGPINWYRAIPYGFRDRVGNVEVPTLFIWGDKDRFVTVAASEGCRDFVTGPFRSERIAGASHWLPEEEPKTVAALLLEHFASHGPK